MYRALSVALLILTALQAGATAPRNALSGHPSPYLAMHADDPVAWQVWDEAILARARREGRLVFISSGYFACHWCHVMQRESYRDADIAARLNRDFIAVKVDRELEPALDAALIDFVRRTRGHAGWPLNVFVTPGGYPLLGFTYLPPERFASVIDGLRARWRADPEGLSRLAREAMAALRAQRAGQASGRPLEGDGLRALVEQSRPLWDELGGGFGQQARFPMAPQLRALLAAEARRSPDGLRPFLNLTLERMAYRGLRDHLDEGFFRYTTDPDWLLPHFEKMLHTNAQLAQLFLEAARVLGQPRWRGVGLRTLDFMLRRMAASDGAFIASLSAVDEQGREGYGYLWSDAQLQAALPERLLRVARAAWNLEGTPPFEYGHLPVPLRARDEVARALKLSRARLDDLLDQARGRLLQARAKRRMPADDKRLAAWNGLALSALARAVRDTDSARYRKAGQRLADVLRTGFMQGDRLRRALRGGGRASAADYAFVARGLWDWADAADDAAAARASAALTRAGWRRFYRDGLWQAGDTGGIATPGGRIALPSAPLPSPSAVLSALARAHPLLREDPSLTRRVESHLARVRARLGGSLFDYADYAPLLAEPG